MFVGPDMLENYGTIEEASQVCESSNADSHLAYIKSKEEFNILMNYMLAYNIEQDWFHSNVALGGVYDVRTASFTYT